MQENEAKSPSRFSCPDLSEMPGALDSHNMKCNVNGKRPRGLFSFLKNWGAVIIYTCLTKPGLQNPHLLEGVQAGHFIFSFFFFLHTMYYKICREKEI